MIIGVPKESFPGETRVATSPDAAAALKKAGFEVRVESDAGIRAGFLDSAYEAKGAVIEKDRAKLFAEAAIILQVRTPGANPEGGPDLEKLREGQVLIGLADPLGGHENLKAMAATKAVCFALEMVPRITRAQSMDVLSSQANLAGYKAVLVGANALPKIFPMLMTAAGTLKPSRVLVIGAGVAGLQAIATARRLGAVVSGYDVRAACKEQVESLGAKFVELEIKSEDAEDEGGYAKEQSEDQIKRQQDAMTKVVADSDVVITTAAIPGRKSPVIVTESMVKKMRPGSVIVDLAAERGGNCELTEADKTVVKHEVTLIGPTNLLADVPFDASMMFANNLVQFLKNLYKDEAKTADYEDEIVAASLVCRGGEVVNPRIRQVLKLPDLPAKSEDKAEGDDKADDKKAASDKEDAGKPAVA